MRMKAVGRKYQKSFSTLEKMFGDRNVFRAEMKKVAKRPPAILYIGKRFYLVSNIPDDYILQLESLHDIPLYLDNGMVNFKKLRAVSSILDDIETSNSINFR